MSTFCSFLWSSYFFIPVAMTWGHPKPRPSFSSSFSLNSFLSPFLPSSPYCIFTSSIPSRRQHGLPSLKAFQKADAELLRSSSMPSLRKPDGFARENTHPFSLQTSTIFWEIHMEWTPSSGSQGQMQMSSFHSERTSRLEASIQNSKSACHKLRGWDPRGYILKIKYDLCLSYGFYWCKEIPWPRSLLQRKYI